MKVNTKNPLIDTNDINSEIVIDMKIEIANENQLTNVPLITNLDEDFIPMISKFKRKRKKRKQK
jgi:hypothetical protein